MKTMSDGGVNAGGCDGLVRGNKLVIYHANGSGTGAALQLEPRINRRDGDRYNCFFLDMATQKSVAGKVGSGNQPATFDWERKLTVKLDFPDICEILAVLEGRQERAGGQRNGLFHETGSANTLISFQRNAEKGGYFVGLSRKDHAGGQAVRVNLLLTEVEAVGLRHVLEVGLFFVLFHAQLLSSRSTVRERRDVGDGASGSTRAA
jgi:hypothetical protein